MTVLDLHAHFPMHLGLPDIPSDHPLHKIALKAVFDLANEADNYEPINRPRVTEDYIQSGGITGVGSVLYDPEDEFLVTQEPHPYAIDHLLQLCTNVEVKAADAGIAVAKTTQVLDDCIANDKPFLFHTVEGGHALSGNPANVERLAQIKACYLTLAHMRYMGLASCAKALPCKTDFWNKILDPEEPNCGLMPLGFDVLDAIFATNIALDITHCSDLSHADIQSYYKSHNITKPVISSHCGVRGVANTTLNLSDETVEFIGSTGGVVGVILWTYSLGADTSTQGGFEKYCQTIEYIRNKAGDDAVSIGTDLDGFVQPIADCRNYSNIGNFAAMLKQRYDGQPEFLEKLLWRNARRVLADALG